ncbi:MFS transporter [Streptomyces broussonetiae]|uniref:Uncharacterized protein n=1 Tax=Streptomyces broussonetiae TaxID=2686304 RepID=A0A6I6NJK9_9ACTN|nr:MFS transporter [Streptomyces broussonetiae]QHA09145.1 hypothetical protein GQF42_43400 [Streptomyces broussonetiae]
MTGHRSFIEAPPWVHARGLAVYPIVLLGGQGLGSLLWFIARPWVPREHRR